MISFVIPFFPPSTNKAYYVRHGKLHLSKVGKAFKTQVTSHLVQTYPAELRFFLPNTPYFTYMRAVMDQDLENSGWKGCPTKRCSTRYKKFDATNRIKLAEDACCEAFGIDDSQIIAFLVEKMHGGPGIEPHLELFVWNLEAERSPLDHFLRL